jgi:NAD-dependent dihydropyrimidine dehydrogenase PreA subunit
MAYKITDECTACGSCMDSCPSNAISEGDVYSIGEDCAECGLCVDECPMGAIIEE